MSKVQEFTLITWPCRICGEKTKVIYEVQKGDRTLYACEKCATEA